MSLRTSMIALMGASALAMAACSAPPQTPAKDAKKADACEDGGAKLATLGLCQADAAKLLAVSGGPDPTLPEGCSWVVQETPMPAEGEVLLYRAASCKGVTTKLVAKEGAKLVNYQYETSAVFAQSADTSAMPIITQLDVETPDPKTSILGQVVLVAETANEQRNCEIRSAGVAEWPSDALVADLNAAAKARARIKDGDGVRAACGFYGLDTSAAKFWLVRQGRAFFVDQGQEDSDIDARSITVVSKAADGAWAVALSPPVAERN